MNHRDTEGICSRVFQERIDELTHSFGCGKSRVPGGATVTRGDTLQRVMILKITYIKLTIAWPVSRTVGLAYLPSVVMPEARSYLALTG